MTDFKLKTSLARNNLYIFCTLMMPKFFLPSRPYLKKLCYSIQDFIEGSGRGLIINVPPRHGKTLTVELATSWWLGLNRLSGVITASYNELLAGRFSKAVRNIISMKKVGSNIIYSDIFPEVGIQYGDASQTVWALEDSHFSFLATSPGGTATGAGCQLLIIDDLIKNAFEANSERALDAHEEWYYNTIVSRLEVGAKQIIIQTRWATKDLTGKLLTNSPDSWSVIKMPAFDGEKMLDETILGRGEYTERKRFTDPVIFSANYDQEPFDSKNKLYENFRYYLPAELPESFERIEVYCDSADEGADSLSAWVYGIKNRTVYILDCIHTKEPMEVTEIKLSKSITFWQVNRAYVESNNGGRGFARAVEKRLRDAGNLTSSMSWFHQSASKVSRIITASSAVQNVIIFPHDFKDRWPSAYQELISMGRNEKWEHDDAADSLTGIIEKSLTKTIVMI